MLLKAWYMNDSYELKYIVFMKTMFLQLQETEIKL